MPKATLDNGSLIPISDCYIIIPIDGRGRSGLSEGENEIKITLDILPDISDSKSANYNDETVIGRSSPLKTYSNSDNRSITMQLHFIVSKPSDVTENLQKLRAIQSAVYPRDGANGAPFIPPPVCRIKCGSLLSAQGDICVILKQYSVKFPTEVAWNENYFTPMKFDVDTTWDVVYASSDLPGQERIFGLGV
jgi:hypothetical protein